MSNSIKEEILEFELNSEEKYLKEYQKVFLILRILG